MGEGERTKKSFRRIRFVFIKKSKTWSEKASVSCFGWKKEHTKTKEEESYRRTIDDQMKQGYHTPWKKSFLMLFIHWSFIHLLVFSYCFYPFFMFLPASLTHTSLGKFNYFNFWTFKMHNLQQSNNLSPFVHLLFHLITWIATCKLLSPNVTFFLFCFVFAALFITFLNLCVAMNQLPNCQWQIWHWHSILFALLLINVTFKLFLVYK